MSCEGTERGRRRVPVSASSDLLLGRGDDALWLEPEFLLQFLQRRRGAEGLHADHMAAGPDVTLPSKRRALLNSDPCGYRGRQHRLTVLDGLSIEQLPGGQADNATADSF